LPDPATGEVVGGNVNAAPQARLSGFVRRVEIRRPLQADLCGGPLLEREKRALGRDELAEPAGEVRASGEARQHLRSRAAERAVTRDERRERRRHERAALV